MPKKRKGGPAKRSSEKVVVSATTRKPDEGPATEPELGPLPGSVPRILAGNPDEGYPSQGPGWERRSQTFLENWVQSGQLPATVLVPTPAPAYSDKECETGFPPIGGPGWELEITPYYTPRTPRSVRAPDHVCGTTDYYCTFPQRISVSKITHLPAIGVHACRPNDPWCQSGHWGRCPRQSDRKQHRLPIVDCWCPDCQRERGYHCTKEWTGPCILPSRQSPVLAGNPAEGYPSQGPGWERRPQDHLESFVLSGLARATVLLPMLAPAFSDKECETGSPPIGGPGWELEITPYHTPRTPRSVRTPDHVCGITDDFCTFPQRFSVSKITHLPTIGVHACRPNDTWCQSGHWGRCPRQSDRRHLLPIKLVSKPPAGKKSGNLREFFFRTSSKTSAGK